MVILLCNNTTLYHTLKKTFTLVEYQAHDIEFMIDRNLSFPLPFPLGYHKEHEILLCSPPDEDEYHSHILHAYVGMLYVSFPFTPIIYVEENARISHVRMIGAIQHSHNHDAHKNTQRPLYLDMVIPSSPRIEEEFHYVNDHLYNYLHTANKFFESHFLHILHIPPHLTTDSEVYDDLQYVITYIRTMPFTHPIPHTTLSWYKSARKEWRLSSTESKQLYALLMGYHQKGTQEELPKALHTLLENPVLTKEKAHMYFTQCRHLLLHTLH